LFNSVVKRPNENAQKTDRQPSSTAMFGRVLRSKIRGWRQTCLVFNFIQLIFNNNVIFCSHLSYLLLFKYKASYLYKKYRYCLYTKRLNIVLIILHMNSSLARILITWISYFISKEICQKHFSTFNSTYSNWNLIWRSILTISIEKY
jgi:hypothetical protein